MKKALMMCLFISTLSCKREQSPNLLHKQAQALNDGMERLLIDNISLLSASAAEYPNEIKPYYRDAKFYYDNTYFLINGNSKQPDSLIIWRLTETMQATKYGFKPQLDSALVFGGSVIQTLSG